MDVKRGLGLDGFSPVHQFPENRENITLAGSSIERAWCVVSRIILSHVKGIVVIG